MPLNIHTWGSVDTWGQYALFETASVLTSIHRLEVAHGHHVTTSPEVSIALYPNFCRIMMRCPWFSGMDTVWCMYFGSVQFRPVRFTLWYVPLWTRFSITQTVGMRHFVHILSCTMLDKLVTVAGQLTICLELIINVPVSTFSARKPCKDSRSQSEMTWAFTFLPLYSFAPTTTVLPVALRPCSCYFDSCLFNSSPRAKVSSTLLSP